MYTHSCIKCSKKYEDEDPDAYYCPTCLKEKKAIADEIDKKIQARPRKETRSALEEYDNAPKVHGFMQVRI